MKLDLKLSQKAVMLAAVPLIFELGFFCTLVYEVKNFDTQTKIQNQARDILTTVNLLLKSFLQAAGAMGMFQVHHEERFRKQYDHAIVEMKRLRLELDGLIKGDTSEDLVEFVGSSDELIRALEQCSDLVSTGDRIDRMRSIIRAQKLLTKIDSSGNKVIDRLKRTNDEQTLMQAKIYAMIEWLVVAAGLSIVIAIVLTIYFVRGTSKRLNVLMDNTLSLAMEKPLQAPLEGKDEIATIDGVFHKMAEALSSARTKEQALTRNALDVICSLDSKFKFTKMNQAVKNVWGYDDEELLGRSLLSLVDKDSVEHTRELLEEIVRTNSTAPFELRMQRKDRTPCDMSWSAQWSESDQSLFCVAHDVSERKRLERMKQEVVAMVSHDLRSPLTSIQAMFDLLEAGALGELNDRGAEKIQRSSASLARLISMINDLLDMEKLESGMFELTLQTVPFTTLAKHSLEGIQTSADQKKIHLEVAQSTAPVYCDGDRIVRVLINFLSNAIKFSPTDSTIKIEVEDEEDFVKINVIDQGKGIPPDKLESVFERFKQVERADETTKGGSGLGLAICKAIIDAHQGTIGVESEIGKGSTFWIKLPKQKQSERKQSLATV
ncbi:MAG TPA: PAS domain-containing sensor histidine kinase [Drouetiella sp.]